MRSQTLDVSVMPPGAEALRWRRSPSMPCAGDVVAVRETTYTLTLLGCWGLRVDGEALHLHLREQRVLALLGLRGHQSRTVLAGLLWPDSPEARARASLRTSLMRIRQRLGAAISVRRDDVGLSEGFTVDVATLRFTLDRIEDDGREVASDPVPALQILREPDLLVGWYDDWVLAERERLRHRRVRALETLALASLDAGRAPESISFAEEAAKLEPLLESAVTLHVRALLHDGDLTAALTEYRAFRQRLDAELGVSPPQALTHLLREAKAQRLAVGDPSAVGILPPIAPVRHGRDP